MSTASTVERTGYLAFVSFCLKRHGSDETLRSHSLNGLTQQDVSTGTYFDCPSVYPRRVMLTDPFGEGNSCAALINSSAKKVNKYAKKR